MAFLFDLLHKRDLVFVIGFFYLPKMFCGYFTKRFLDICCFSPFVLHANGICVKSTSSLSLYVRCCILSIVTVFPLCSCKLFILMRLALQIFSCHLTDLLFSSVLQKFSENNIFGKPKAEKFLPHSNLWSMNSHIFGEIGIHLLVLLMASFLLTFKNAFAVST